MNGDANSSKCSIHVVKLMCCKMFYQMLTFFNDVLEILKHLIPKGTTLRLTL